MKITPDAQDADEFIRQVEAVANGLVGVHAPHRFILVKVSSWFGFKWLGFSGKALGAVGVWRRPVTIPPFVPSRIVSERRFASPDYLEEHEGAPVHLKVSANEALRRTLFEAEPHAALLWYSGDSRLSGRGSAMAYIPTDGAYHCWYAAWSHKGSWQVEDTREIARAELLRLMEPPEMQTV